MNLYTVEYPSGVASLYASDPSEAAVTLGRLVDTVLDGAIRYGDRVTVIVYRVDDPQRKFKYRLTAEVEVVYRAVTVDNEEEQSDA